jgi:hypothetical protein
MLGGSLMGEACEFELVFDCFINVFVGEEGTGCVGLGRIATLRCDDGVADCGEDGRGAEAITFVLLLLFVLLLRG